MFSLTMSRQKKKIKPHHITHTSTFSIELLIMYENMFVEWISMSTLDCIKGIKKNWTQHRKTREWMSMNIGRGSWGNNKKKKLAPKQQTQCGSDWLLVFLVWLNLLYGIHLEHQFSVPHHTWNADRTKRKLRLIKTTNR